MTEETQALATRQEMPLVTQAYSPEAMVAQVHLIQDVMGKVMKDGEHYGVIPGTNKPSLLKPGAEKLSMTFRLRPEFKIDRSDLAHGHREYEIVCTLFDPSGASQGQGVGSCTTMESRYRWRKAEQACPECGKPCIIRGKKEYGGGWLCFKKKGGCGAKFNDGDPRIENQDMGRVENEDIADAYNTVLKMAKKRAMVDAVLTATAASDIFTQDTEDMAANAGQAEAPAATPPPATLNEDWRDAFAKWREALGDKAYLAVLLTFSVQAGNEINLTEETAKEMMAAFKEARAISGQAKAVEQAPSKEERPIDLDTYQRLAAAYKAHLGEDPYHGLLAPYTDNGEGKSNTVPEGMRPRALQTLHTACVTGASEDAPFPDVIYWTEACLMKKPDLLEGIQALQQGIEGVDALRTAYLGEAPDKALQPALRVYHAALSQLLWEKAAQQADETPAEQMDGELFGPE